MVQTGELQLQQAVNPQLRSWQIPANALTAQVPLTLEPLLRHTAGMAVHGFMGYPAGTPVPDTVTLLKGSAPANLPPVLASCPMAVTYSANTTATRNWLPLKWLPLVCGPLHKTWPAS